MTALHRTPSAEIRLCDNCGKPTFFNYAMWSSGPDGGSRTHGPGDRFCEKAAEALEQMPGFYSDLIQALVELQEQLGGFIFQASDEDWENVDLLRRQVLSAYQRTVLGIEAAA